MQQLQFVELDEGGRLVFEGPGGTRYAVIPDESLKAALRPRPISSRSVPLEEGAATPRQVQSMIRAGQTSEEVATQVGWELTRVQRFAAPVLAEQEHVVGLAQQAPVRQAGRTDGSHRLGGRVRERLGTRGVKAAQVSWSAARPDQHGPWTIRVHFPAGGKQRVGAWRYDIAARTLEALDDEARWLSEDEQALPGGLSGHPLLGESHSESESADLMAAVRQRRQERGRRPRRSAPEQAGSSAPANISDARGENVDDTPESGQLRNEPLPFEGLDYDPEEMGDPPAAHPRPGAFGVVADAEAAPPTVDSTETPEASVSEPEPGRRGRGRAGRRERRLRLPKLPAAALDDRPDDSEEEHLEGSYARISHDPNEVSFEEFFGMDSDDAEGVEAEAGDADHADPDHEDPDHEDSEDDAAQIREPDPTAASDASGIDVSGAGEEEETPSPVADLTTEHDVASEQAAPQQQVKENTTAKPASRKRGRTSVPSWDDIMFGSKD